MKTTTFIFALLISVSAFASDKYTEQMSKHIHAVYTAKSVDEYQSAINALDRIALAEKTKWEPYYYSAFGNLMLATQTTEGAKKDSYLDLALAAIEKGKTIQANESELIALEGFVHMIRLTVDPGTRGPQYSGMAMQAFGKALGINPNNPRALALMAQMQFGTAQFFGSSTTEACGMAKKALEQFGSFKSDNPLAPVWGKEMTDELLKQCK
jgi:tetratricopeptide (TPR) repeat protein